MSILMFCVILGVVCVLVGGFLNLFLFDDFMHGVFQGILVAAMIFFIVFGTMCLKGSNSTEQQENIIEVQSLVSGYSDQHIEGNRNVWHFVINTNEIYRYYYELDAHSIKQGSIPADKTTIIFTNEDYRVETIRQVIEERTNLGFLYYADRQEEVYYRLYIPEGSIVSGEFIFN